MFVYGGTYKVNDYQIARVDGCSLNRIGELDFSFANGGCAVTQGVIESELFLCFPSSGTSKCRVGKGPGGPFTEIPPSVTSHRYTKIAASDSKLKNILRSDFKTYLEHILAVGCWNREHSQAELFDHASNRYWFRIDDYPYHRDIHEYSMLYHNNAFYVFGGHAWKANPNRFDDIARLDAVTYKWSKAGQLNQARSQMATIWSQDHFLVFGGADNNNEILPTEKCYFSGEEEVKCVQQTPEVQFVEWSFSELFNVEINFCLD